MGARLEPIFVRHQNKEIAGFDRLHNSGFSSVFKKFPLWTEANSQRKSCGVNDTGIHVRVDRASESGQSIEVQWEF